MVPKDASEMRHDFVDSMKAEARNRLLQDNHEVLVLPPSQAAAACRAMDFSVSDSCCL